MLQGTTVLVRGSCSYFYIEQVLCSRQGLGVAHFVTRYN